MLYNLINESYFYPPTDGKVILEKQKRSRQSTPKNKI